MWLNGGYDDVSIRMKTITICPKIFSRSSEHAYEGKRICTDDDIIKNLTADGNKPMIIKISMMN